MLMSQFLTDATVLFSIIAIAISPLALRRLMSRSEVKA